MLQKFTFEKLNKWEWNVQEEEEGEEKEKKLNEQKE